MPTICKGAFRTAPRRLPRTMAAIALCAVATGAGAVAESASSSDPPPAAVVRQSLARWQDELRVGARIEPGLRFPNLSAATLRTRLASEARRYHFEIISLKLLRPRQLAPLIIVEADRPHELAAATEAILQQLDPAPASGRTPAAFEGIFFEARGSDGSPLSIAYDSWRGGPNRTGGGQWAVTRSLLPLPDQIR
ncbi:MAG TPA: hypothetical protein VGF46_13110 [Gaiellales bacterium]|jgi:hypothetical protein